MAEDLLRGERVAGELGQDRAGAATDCLPYVICAL